MVVSYRSIAVLNITRGALLMAHVTPSRNVTANMVM